jgi:prepilin-type N-terminal cleavage/methylation domain-containing protein
MQELNKSANKKGFTLIELVVAMAIFLIIIVIAFSTLSSYFAVRSANEQEMILQQNFRTALDRMVDDFRQAANPVGDTIILSPVDDNSMAENLKFETNAGTVEYKLEPAGSGTYAIKRQVGTASPPQPVTEEMHQLVKLYFVRSGGKVIMIVVGKLKYFGKERTISFTSLVFSRNSAYEVP